MLRYIFSLILVSCTVVPHRLNLLFLIKINVATSQLQNKICCSLELLVKILYKYIDYY